MAKIDALFRYLKQNGGSDLHLAAGLEPRIRHHGQLKPVPDWAVLTDASLRALLREIHHFSRSNPEAFRLEMSDDLAGVAGGHGVGLYDR